MYICPSLQSCFDVVTYLGNLQRFGEPVQGGRKRSEAVDTNPDKCDQKSKVLVALDKVPE